MSGNPQVEPTGTPQPVDTFVNMENTQPINIVVKSEIDDAMEYAATAMNNLNSAVLSPNTDDANQDIVRQLVANVTGLFHPAAPVQRKKYRSANLTELHRDIDHSTLIFGFNERGEDRARVIVPDPDKPGYGRCYVKAVTNIDTRVTYHCTECKPNRYPTLYIFPDNVVKEAPFENHVETCAAKPLEVLLQRQQEIVERLERRAARLSMSSNPGRELRANPRPARITSPISPQRTQRPSTSARIRSRSPIDRAQSNLLSAGSRHIAGGFRLHNLVPARPASAALEAQSPARTPEKKPVPSKTVSVRRGRLPDIGAMKDVPSGSYRFSSLKVNRFTKLWIITGEKRGLEYKWGRNVDGADYFHCSNCLIRSKNRHKSKAFVQVSNGIYTVKEGKHYLTCHPAELDLDLNESEPLLARRNRAPSEEPEEELDLKEETKEEDELLSDFGDITEAADLVQKPPVSNSSGSSSLPTPINVAPYLSGNEFLASISTKALANDDESFACIPSSASVRQVLNRLGLQDVQVGPGYQYWVRAVAISEFHGASKPGERGTLSSYENSGFRCFSLYFTGTERYNREIEKAVKSFYFDRMAPELNDARVKENLISSDITVDLIRCLAKWLGLRIGVFEKARFTVFGEWNNENLGSIFLAKTNNGFQPVYTIV